MSEVLHPVHFAAPSMALSRGEQLLDFIEDEIQQQLNPGDDECWNCSGEGYTYDCIDGCCADAESGCEDCASRCPECARHTAQFKRGVRVEVLRSLDIDIAVAWAKKEGRWRDGISPALVLLNLHAARAACDAFTAEERADSACWVEGLS
jgi:hypothetical protein